MVRKMKVYKEYPYKIGEPVPVPLAIAAMLATEVLHARSAVEQSKVVHRYAHFIADAIGGTDET